MLLVDSDVLFNRAVNEVMDRFELSSAMAGGTYRKNWRWARLCPWFCLINVVAVQLAEIRWYDPSRLGVEIDGGYDVGSSFYADVLAGGYGVMDISMGEQCSYIHHFEGMSWRGTREQISSYSRELAERERQYWGVGNSLE
jgi:hypothetical protein